MSFMIEKSAQQHQVAIKEARQAREAYNDDLLQKKCILSRLLPELRLEIYDLVLKPNQILVVSKDHRYADNRATVTVRAEPGDNATRSFRYKFAISQTCRFFRKETLGMVYGKYTFKFNDLEIASRFFRSRPQQVFEQLVQRQFILQRLCCGGPVWGHGAHVKKFNFDLKEKTVFTLGEVAEADKKFTHCIECTRAAVPKFQAELEEDGVVGRNKGKRKLLAMVKMVFESQFNQGRLPEDAEEDESEETGEDMADVEENESSGEASEHFGQMVRYYLDD